MLLEEQSAKPVFAPGSNGYPTVSFDPFTRFQTIDGFGYTLTQGSAYVLMTEIDSSRRTALLQEMFDPAPGIATGVGSSFLRIGIGATDLSLYPYTYNDLPPGQTDPDQSEFGLEGPDLDYLIPVLQEIVSISPDIRIKAVPWTAPAWMKTSDSLSDGHLKPEYYASYATYFVKYLQAMRELGIEIYALAPQNEPEHCCNNPAMLMTAPEQIAFILELGPALQAAGFATKILTWDHNLDVPEYPLEVLASEAGQYVDGVAWHLYAGAISTMSEVHNAYPDKNMYFTEQYTSSSGSFLGDMAWHMKNVMLGGTNNWARAVLEWNLAADANEEPHTEGGCSVCLGAYTVDAGTVTRNVAFYNVAHMSRFVRPGAVRVATYSSSGSLHAAGFVNADTQGSTRVLVVYNDSNRPTATFNIGYQGQIATVTLPKKSVATYLWSDSGGGVNAPPVASFTHSATGLTVDFDASGSLDTDGFIANPAWDFGDGSSGNGELTSHTYAGAGDYTVLLTVTDDDGTTAQTQQTVAVTDTGGAATSLHVESLSAYAGNIGQGWKQGIAEVLLRDNLGQPVAEVMVTVTFAGTFNETVSGQTDPAGFVRLFTADRVKGATSVSACVDSISTLSLDYIPNGTDCGS